MTPAFQPGPRLSLGDAIALLVMVLATIGAAQVHLGAAWLIGTACVHFGLFCNVFRVPLALELVWATWFVALTIPTITTSAVPVAGTVALAFGLGAMVIALAMRRPDYHGLFWGRVNPELPAWWSARQGSRSRPPSA
jgi:hypothetical protein